MTSNLITRRSLLTGLSAIIAAPAIVRATSLMPVKAWSADTWFVSVHPAGTCDTINIDTILRAREILKRHWAEEVWRQTRARTFWFQDHGLAVLSPEQYADLSKP